MIIHPFNALRARPETVQQVASVPYDVVDTAEAKALAAGNPLSFLHVVRSEIDLPANTDPYDEKVYLKAAEHLQLLRDQGDLVRDEKPCLYAYRVTSGHHVQLGLLACCSVDECDRGVIKKHELTRRDKEDDRTKHMLALGAQPGPVLVAYGDHPQIDGLLVSAVESPALLDCTSETNVRHEVWPIEDTSALVQAFATVPCAYIADGHHRTAAAAWARLQLQSDNPNHTGREEYNYFLTALFPTSQTKILAYNRVINGLNGLTPAQVLDRASEKFNVSATSNPIPLKSQQFCAYLAGTWHLLAIKPEHVDRTDVVKSLDASLLHEHLIDPIFGIKDLRRDPRITFVGSACGSDTLEQLVNEIGGGIAFSMYPTSIEQLIAVADGGHIMPPKSTWFEPKLRSGLVVHLI